MPDLISKKANILSLINLGSISVIVVISCTKILSSSSKLFEITKCPSSKLIKRLSMKPPYR